MDRRDPWGTSFEAHPYAYKQDMANPYATHADICTSNILTLSLFALW